MGSLQSGRVVRDILRAHPGCAAWKFYPAFIARKQGEETTYNIGFPGHYSEQLVVGVKYVKQALRELIPNNSTLIEVFNRSALVDPNDKVVIKRTGEKLYKRCTDPRKPWTELTFYEDATSVIGLSINGGGRLSFNVYTKESIRRTDPFFLDDTDPYLSLGVED